MNCIRLSLFFLLCAQSAGRAADAPPGRVMVEAKTISGGETMRAEGDVRACFGGYVLHTESLEYDRREDLLRAPHSFELRTADEEYVLRGDSFRYRPRAQTGAATNANIAVGGEGLRASGESLYLEEGRFRAEAVEMSSCKTESRDWVLSADSIMQDEENSVAVRGAVLRAGGIPVMYLPVFYVRGDEEKRGGFLPPEFQYSADEGGNLRLPYYFFLADNYDATLTPEWFGEHGFLLGGEFRYLTAAHRGQTDFGWAPGGESRGRQNFSHEWNFARGRVQIAAENVSDDEYFSDFADESELLAKRNLPRKIIAEYARDGWRTSAALESFKTINYAGAPPHDLVPQLRLRRDGSHGGYVWNSEWEFSRFAANRPRQFEGDRWLWRAGIYRRWNVGGAAVYPEAGFHAVKYSGEDGEFLEANDETRDIDGDADFLTPYMRVRIESGDRPLAESDWTYQLRGVYAYSPESEQQNAPVFDSVLREFSAGGIYDWNRFSGGDRAADAHVAAYGADFRWWDSQSGRSRLDLELAQRYYLRRPRVVLPDEGAPPQRGFANLFAALRARLNDKWKIEGDAEWNPAADSFESVYADVRADFGGGRFLRAGGLWEESESVLAGGAIPLGARADFAFLARYILDDDEISESETALVFRGECGCWSLFLRAGNLITSEADNKTSYSVGFEFKGLGRAGSNGYEKIVDDLR